MPSGAGEPAGSPSLDAGTWLATLRVRQGLTRRELADRAQVPYPVLTTIEAAVELAPPAVLAACARALGVDPGLLARRYLPASADDMEVAAAERIRAGQDVLALPPAEAARARPLPELASELRQAASWTEAARFEAAAAVLPRLVTGLRLAVLTLTGEDKQTARRLLAEANRVGFLAFAGTPVARAAAGGGRELAASTPPPRGGARPPVPAAAQAGPQVPRPGTGAVVSVLYALHLPWWLVSLGGALCGVVYLLPGLSLPPEFPGDFGDVFPPVTLHA